MEDRWLSWVKRLQSVASTGRHFTRDAFDRERYDELGAIAAQMLAALADAPVAVIPDMLAEFGIAAHGRPEHRGVYVGDNAICAVGIAVKRMTSLHGLALNVSTELDYDRLVNPCGMPAFGITSMERELGVPVTLAAASQALLSALARRFDVHIGQSEGRPEPAAWGT